MSHLNQHVRRPAADRANFDIDDDYEDVVDHPGPSKKVRKPRGGGANKKSEKKKFEFSSKQLHQTSDRHFKQPRNSAKFSKFCSNELPKTTFEQLRIGSHKIAKFCSKRFCSTTNFFEQFEFEFYSKHLRKNRRSSTTTSFKIVEQFCSK